MWKEAVVAYFKALSQNLAEELGKPSVRIAGHWAEI
jgi:hypothetical protein